jgi:hypothetical protein
VAGCDFWIDQAEEQSTKPADRGNQEQQANRNHGLSLHLSSPGEGDWTKLVG